MYQIAFNDDLYEVLVPGLEMSSHGTGDIVFRASDQMKIVNKCDHCGRFGLEEIVFTTVELRALKVFDCSMYFAPWMFSIVTSRTKSRCLS